VTSAWKNKLYFGDNLAVLREHVKDETVDLIYLDPPFNSAATYNVLFKETSGRRSAAQITAFDDTWHWGIEAEAAYHDIVTGGGKLSELIQALRGFLGQNDMMAYLTMMAPRLRELHRVLKPAGSLYLHCDPTAAHYLKLLLDAVFSPVRFLNEITWKRTHSHGNVGRNFGSICDTLLVFTKGETYTWNQQYAPFDEDYVEATFKYRDPDGRQWQSVTLRNPGPRPNLHYPYPASNGVTYQPHPNGWACDIRRMRQC
jgi:site-specific DNA-methyltransferase (adenine-specific)